MILTRQSIEQLRFPCWFRRFYRAEKVDDALDEIAAAAEALQAETARLREAEAAARAEAARLAAEVECLLTCEAETRAALDALETEALKMRTENKRLQRREVAMRAAYLSAKKSGAAARTRIEQLQTATHGKEEAPMDAFSKRRKQPLGGMPAEAGKNAGESLQAVNDTELTDVTEAEERRRSRQGSEWKRDLQLRLKRQ